MYVGVPRLSQGSKDVKASSDNKRGGETHLAEGWFVVQSRASVSMSASSNFEIKGTINPEKGQTLLSQAHNIFFI